MSDDLLDYRDLAKITARVMGIPEHAVISRPCEHDFRVDRAKRGMPKLWGDRAREVTEAEHDVVLRVSTLHPDDVVAALRELSRSLARWADAKERDNQERGTPER